MRIRISGIATVVGGLTIIFGTFLPFNNSTISGLLTLSRNAYQMGSQLSDNGVGIIDSILGLALVALGVGLLCGYRGHWFNPVQHSIAGFIVGFVIFNQMNADKTTLHGVRYEFGSGWYVSVAGAALCMVAAFVRFPPNEKRLEKGASPSLP